MKRVFSLLMIILCVVTLSSCGKNDNVVNNDTGKEVKEEYTSNGEKNPVAGKSITEFKVKDIYGNEVTQDIFKDKKITMINIWATFCGPCIEEIPYLQEIYAEKREEGFNLLGIVADGNSEENIEMAKKIIEKSNVEYKNILIGDSSLKDIVSEFKYVPVSIFVDSEGKIKDVFSAGAESKEEYLEKINSLLEKESK
ncbi:TlpA disulfide reductase family protein [Oceanirhabdus sp. W0125-5]|uniref:TlpA disulfide reductase family protein n=1 Tax=Oceanirhabdus sp. W0125-5 TaxID=2999116 RepID=UPI0022F30FC2|nr:TlpA disulfide reductase family protein [Oceanirhabdus sp. W0125-5]WBW98192.1 TlpA disulfide reductase family protein [Oceanirhabdus sp. W0125-5]